MQFNFCTTELNALCQFNGKRQERSSLVNFPSNGTMDMQAEKTKSINKFYSATVNVRIQKIYM